jgi:hypothetical protein
MRDQEEHRIRARAHQMWVDDGRPEGRALHYWLAAESEIKGESGVAGATIEQVPSTAKTNGGQSSKAEKALPAARQKKSLDWPAVADGEAESKAALGAGKKPAQDAGKKRRRRTDTLRDAGV